MKFSGVPLYLCVVLLLCGGSGLCAQTQGSTGDDPARHKQLIEDADALLKKEKFREALSLTSTAEAGFTQSTPPALIARCMRIQGEALILAAEYDSAVTVIHKGISQIQKTNDRAEQARLETALGKAFRYQGDYKSAATQFHASLEYFENQNDSAGIMENRLELGILHYLAKEYTESEKIFQECTSFFDRSGDSVQLGFGWSLLCLNYSEQELYDKSIEAGETSLRIRRALRDTRGEGESLNNLALAYKAKKEWKSALEYLELSRDALTRGDDFRMIAVIMGNIADCYLHMGQGDKAIETYKSAMQSARNTGLMYDLSVICRKMARAYESMGKYEDALVAYREYVSLRDTLLTGEKTKAIKEMEVKYKTQQQLDENQRLEIQAAADQQHFWGLLIGFVSFLVFSVVVVGLLINRVRQSRKLLEKEKQLFTAREKLGELELNKARSELELNQTKLESFTASFLRKNELIEDLENQLKSLQIKDEAGDGQRMARLEELLRMKILTEDDWEVFKKHFEQVHKGFLTNLRSKLPDLTTGDERLFILLKLNLHSKEISDILGVSPDSVKKARYRLRKKLNLNEEDNLEAYIQSFS